MSQSQCKCTACPLRHITIALAVVLLAAFFFQDTLYSIAVKFFGPPAVAMTETHSDTPSTQPAVTFDHSSFDAILKARVDPAGYVDYAAIAKDTAALDNYITSLATAPFDDLSRDGKLALLINAYNAFTLKLIVEHYDDGKLASIRDIPEKKRWDHTRWRLAGQTYSLNTIEHELVRENFIEPRIHFALVCAAVSCPPLRAEAYTADRLEAQLAAQSTYVHTHPRWLQLNSNKNQLKLTALYQWYAGDFEQVSGSVLQYVATQSPPVERIVNRNPDISYIDYSWRLNDQAILED